MMMVMMMRRDEGERKRFFLFHFEQTEGERGMECFFSFKNECYDFLPEKKKGIDVAKRGGRTRDRQVLKKPREGGFFSLGFTFLFRSFRKMSKAIDVAFKTTCFVLFGTAVVSGAWLSASMYKGYNDVKEYQVRFRFKHAIRGRMSRSGDVVVLVFLFFPFSLTFDLLSYKKTKQRTHPTPTTPPAPADPEPKAS
jgi:hypothetical protein